jgi:diguanylate cyclase (GGDEF)-like protein
VILPEIDTAGGKQFAEKIRKMVAEERFMFEGQAISSTVSAGIAELDAEMANAEQLISVTDARLYRAKESGRNQSVAVD